MTSEPTAFDLLKGLASRASSLGAVAGITAYVADLKWDWLTDVDEGVAAILAFVVANFAADMYSRRRETVSTRRRNEVDCRQQELEQEEFRTTIEHWIKRDQYVLTLIDQLEGLSAQAALGSARTGAAQRAAQFRNEFDLVERGLQTLEQARERCSEILRAPSQIDIREGVTDQSDQRREVAEAPDD